MGETPRTSSQVQTARSPSVTATAACSGLRPVAKALGCISGDTYSRGIGIPARSERSRMTAKYSGMRASSAGTARAARMARVSLFQ